MNRTLTTVHRIPVKTAERASMKLTAFDAIVKMVNKEILYLSYVVIKLGKF